MPHLLPPDHPDSAASPFAPFQPAAGVVADDVPDWQNPAGGPKAKDISAELAPELRKQREQEVKDAEESAEAQAKFADDQANRDDDGTVQVVEDGAVKAQKSSSKK